mmetsp:Transcript_116926/g.239242  ORF Transcript_116926/g.239242 Transcript_116926/m.239242 type:complete len:231 (+) Transcript_116926:4496-5188(+)
MDNVTGSVTDDLNLDVAWAIDKSLDKDRSVTETGEGFRTSGFKKRDQLIHGANDSHTLTTASHGSLNNNGQTNSLNKFHNLLRCFQRTITSWNDGNTGIDCGLSCRCFVGKSIEIVNSRANECDVGICASLSKFRRFGEESISGVNSINIGILGDINDLTDVKVSRDRCGIVLLFQQKGSIGTPSVLRVTILVDVNSNSSCIHFRSGTHDSNGNFGAIGCHNVGKEGLFC